MQILTAAPGEGEGVCRHLSAIWLHKGSCEETGASSVSPSSVKWED